MFKTATSLALCATAMATPTLVSTPVGDIQGFETDLAIEFKGIPFGTIPGRWQDATPAEPWSTTLDASADGPACPQICEDGVTLPPNMCPTDMDELNCLSINVYAPKGADTENADVMFFIHGGDFLQGSGGGILYDGAQLVDDAGVIVVTTNYRLGALGFLYSEDADIDGNYGLHDQQLAMQWVQDNIASFGGNPDSVTIFGQSAGAMSVASHMSMPSSAGLFHKAIMHSDPFSLRFREPEDYDGFATTFAKFADCTTGVRGKTIDRDCLNTMDLDDLLAAQKEAQNDLPVELSHVLELFSPFVPVIGVDEFPTRPLEVFQAGDNLDIPFMIGTVAQEGLEFIWGAFPDAVPAIELEVGFQLIFGPDGAKEVLGSWPIPDDQKDDAREYASDLATELLFDCASRNATLSAKHSSDVFLYHFDHPMSFGEKAWGPNFAECYTETCHGGELGFTFMPTAAASMGYDFDDEELALSKSMRAYWLNFAATGNPGTVGDLAWPAYDGASKSSMLFQTPANSIETEHEGETCDTWDSYGYFWA